MTRQRFCWRLPVSWERLIRWCRRCDAYHIGRWPHLIKFRYDH